MSFSHGPLFAATTRARLGDAVLEFAVLGSSSSGNTSVVRVQGSSESRQILIDGGLSPRATRGFLSAIGFDPLETTDLLFTHFDHDHAKECACAAQIGIVRSHSSAATPTSRSRPSMPAAMASSSARSA
jgi:hypothetical protein